MENTRQVIPLFLIAAIITITLLLTRDPEVPQEAPTIPVRTVTIGDDKPVKRLQVSGITQSSESAVLRFQASGRVTEQLVTLGQQLSAGDRIAALYNPELEPLEQAATDNLARLTAEAQQARRDFRRVNTLYQDRAVTRSEWEAAQTKKTASETAVAAARANLERAARLAKESVLIAPFAGSVTEIMLNVGDVVSAGAPAVRLSNPAAVELQLAVSDAILRQINIGQTVVVTRTLEPDSEPLSGLVIEISPHRERGSLPEIVIQLNAAQIGPGVPVTAALETYAGEGVAVPLRAVLMTGDNTVALFRVVDETAMMVPIRPLYISGDSVVIAGGLVAGEEIVTEGLPQLFDGAKVHVSDLADTAGPINTSGTSAEEVSR